MSHQVAKVDADRQIVFGWASVAIDKAGTPVLDHHADLIDQESLENAAYGFVLDFRETGELHRGVAKGNLIESVVFTPEKLEAMGLAEDALPTAWWVGFHVEDAETFAKVKDGTYKMFSIQGRAVREDA